MMRYKTKAGSRDIVFVLIIFIAAILSGEGSIIARESPQKPEGAVPSQKQLYKGSIGILGGITMAAIQGEYNFIPELGVKAVGLCIIGADFNDMNRDEYILSGIVAPVLHLAPEKSFIDMVLMAGLVYSFHHWETKSSNLGIHREITLREGNINDVTFGMGFGILFRFAERFKAGINLWLNYDYGVTALPSFRKTKGNRIILPVPLIECSAQF
jgi:hypothetical protein